MLLGLTTQGEDMHRGAQGDGAVVLKYIGLIIRLGLSMALPVLLGILAGKHLDERFGTGNVFLVILIILGIVTSFANLYRYVNKVSGKK